MGCTEDVQKIFLFLCAFYHTMSTWKDRYLMISCLSDILWFPDWQTSEVNFAKSNLHRLADRHYDNIMPPDILEDREDIDVSILPTTYGGRAYNRMPNAY